mgnify:CR=1 FL=1
MGLDISFYSNLKVNETPTLNKYGDLAGNNIQLFISPKFKARILPFIENTVYSYETTESFRAGSYTSYNGWRNRLSQLAGFTDIREVWTNDIQGPFTELLNFSDCEGTLGTEVCKKLAKDFADFYDEAAKVTDYDGWFFDMYKSWKTAFEVASNNGAVVFH